MKQELPDEGFVRLPIVLAHFPVSRSAWWAGVKIGKYPKPVKLGENTSAWRVEDIRALISLTANDCHMSQQPTPSTMPSHPVDHSSASRAENDLP